MRKGGKANQPGKKRRSLRLTCTDPVHRGGSTEERETSEVEIREQETREVEISEQETREVEIREQETREVEIREQETREVEAREKDTHVNDQEEVSCNEDRNSGDSTNTRNRSVIRGRSPSHETTNDDEENPIDDPVRTRGPNHGVDIPDNLDERPTIIAIGGRFPDSRVTSDITVMLKSHFDGPWPTWSKVPEKMKKNLWAKFTKHFKWSSWRYHQIKKAWEKTNSSRLRDILCQERKRAKILTNSKVPAKWKNQNPTWIPRRYWNILIENEWSTEKWQKKATSGEQNRIKGNDKAQPTYTGGSISIEAHKLKMRKELNRDPTEMELYDRTHKTNRGTGDYVCPKAKRVRENYERNIEKKYPDPEARPSFDPILWSEASGGLSKQRLYGFGSSRRGVGVFGDAYSDWSVGREECLEAEEYDKKIIDVEKMVEDVKLKTEGTIKEAKDEIVKFKKELPDMLRTMLQEIQWTNMKYAGGSGRHQQNYLYDDYSEFSESDESVESSYDRVVELPRKHRVYGNRYDDDIYDDDVVAPKKSKKSKDANGKKKQRDNGKNIQQSRKHKK